MTNKRLTDLVSIKSRYSRSVNLERDISIPDSIDGYVITPKSEELLKRFFNVYQSPSSVRTWTITGAYGSGKSAFALFLLALSSKSSSVLRQKAEEILTNYLKIANPIPKKGMCIAIATAQREPVCKTVFRAIKNAVNCPIISQNELQDIDETITHGDIDNHKLIALLKSITTRNKTPLLIIIDELGKCLEYTAQHGHDLYLLQQIAELANATTTQKIFFIGLLHQSISDYTYALTKTQRNEWDKVQGRFEHITFHETIDSAFYLISQAIHHKAPISDYECVASKWHKIITSQTTLKDIKIQDVVNIYPLHPFSAIVLPMLCSRFAQNDRTLFTFLSSNEPHALMSFLLENEFQKDKPPLLKIHRIYDYFIETSFANTSAFHHNRQRWIEIHNRILDAYNLPYEEIAVLKTIGILNILFTTGSLKASKENVILAMCDDPEDAEMSDYYASVLDRLIKKGFITYRQKIDEFRIWEGSDFDIDAALSEELQKANVSIAFNLNTHYPLSPIIANKHSYKTGTLRLFERVFVDKDNTDDLFIVSSKYDGRICYVIDNFDFADTIASCRSNTAKPLIYVIGKNTELLQEVTSEVSALTNIYKQSAQIQRDAVAKRELQHRLFLAKKMLDESISTTFFYDVTCVYQGQSYFVKNERALDDIISSTCDKSYSKGIVLNNELINRNQLTTQIAKARNEIVTALVEKNHLENFGFVGYGPEVTIYKSLLLATGIHKKEADTWIISRATEDSGIYSAWQRIEEYFLSATTSKKSLAEIYDELQNPPYGIRKGVIPILLLSVLIYHSDTLCLYYDDTYMPVFNVSYAQLIATQPEKFSVKYLQEMQDKKELLTEIQTAFAQSINTKGKNIRNLTLLSIINHLISVVKKLPKCTLNTGHISQEAQQLIKEIIQAKEPDTLLFDTVPKLLNIYPLSIGNLKDFINRINALLKEIDSYYTLLIDDCQRLISKAFNIDGKIGQIRTTLSYRASLIKDMVLEHKLSAFINSACDDTIDDAKWLNSLVMIVAEKPIETWSDEDKHRFEANLSALVKRFKYFEALAVDSKDFSKQVSDISNYVAYKINIASSEGKEIYDTVFLNKHRLEEIKTLFDKNFNNGLFSSLSDDEKKVVATYFLELSIRGRE